MATFSATLTALAAPRRSIPIAAVIASLVGVQVFYGHASAALVPLGMSVTFLALAPWSWRALLANRVSVVGVALYTFEALAVVAVFGIALPRALGLGVTFLTDTGSLAIAGVLYLVGGWGLGRDIDLEQDLEHARLKAIRAHLDPHFLYNTLNAIAEWCVEDPRVAEEATIRLANILRATLEAIEQRRWPLLREIAVVEDLVGLHRLRDTEAFTARFNIDAESTTMEVPPLVLVSLVENAIKHGPRAGHRGEIVVSVRATRDGVHCEIENPGPFAPARSHQGRGLATLRTRLSLAYGSRARLTIAAAGSDRTLAVVDLGRSAP